MEDINYTVPRGMHCYIIHFFDHRQMERCKDLNEEDYLKPYCSKYKINLKWNISGRTLKCNDCLIKEP